MIWKLRKKQAPPAEVVRDRFRSQYARFREVLAANTELLAIISDMEEKLEGREVFGYAYLLGQATRTVFHAGRMVDSFNRLAGGAYPSLLEVMDEIGARIRVLVEERRPAASGPFVLDYADVHGGMVHHVGGKSANLGEIANRIDLPVPEGFAITTAAFDAFMEANDLVETIRRLKIELAAEDTRSILEVSGRIQRLFDESRVPTVLESDMLAAFDRLRDRCRRPGRPFTVAMRSSAIGEDSDLSFAGQYLSVMDVSRDRLIAAYRSVLASLFSPKAIVYRIRKGIQVADIAMSVACIEMVDARSAGVLFTRHPSGDRSSAAIVNAVWGLGGPLVDGTAEPDVFVVSPEEPPRILERNIVDKPLRRVVAADGGLTDEPVPNADRRRSCLEPEEIEVLARCGRKLETHFGRPQDVEWAVDRSGAVTILQSRPLRLKDRAGTGLLPPVPGYPVLLEGGDCASAGVGAGTVHVVRSDQDLLTFPDGGVLVAVHSSPRFVIVLHRAGAVVTETGSVTGHMALLAREFDVPALLNLRGAVHRLPNGAPVTVDAEARRVYQGVVSERLGSDTDRSISMKGTPVYASLRRLADLVVPLHLTDPKSADFHPAHCRTIHDAMRLVHEFSYREMFRISDRVSRHGTVATKLAAPVPLDLYLIDLGGGLTEGGERRRRVGEKDVVSTPFRALLRGLLDERLRNLGPRPVHIGGFLSVMSQQMLSPPRLGVDRFGDKSYAIVSDRYLNFSSRVGYHYSILDAYCGEEPVENYIHFEFKGGAAGDAHRNRRARFLQVVLEHAGFVVEVSGDRAVARFAKQPCARVEENLEDVGRLLLFTRQLDMLMSTEETVPIMAACFLEGDYDLCRIGERSASGPDPAGHR